MILDELIDPEVGVRACSRRCRSPPTSSLTSRSKAIDPTRGRSRASRATSRRDFGRALTSPALAEPQSPSVECHRSRAAGIDDPDLCGRLTVSVLRNVNVGPSPSWIARRLQSAGMRPISNVVDASNLVMLELGQPTHPYDAARVAQRTMRARRARERARRSQTLDGVVRASRHGGSRTRRHRRGLRHRRRRRHGPRTRGHHGRRVERDQRRDDRRPARGGVLRSDDASREVPSDTDCAAKRRIDSSAVSIPSWVFAPPPDSSRSCSESCPRARVAPRIHSTCAG